MSAIHECSLELYERMIAPRQWTEEGRLMCHLGYMWEKEIKHRLFSLGLYSPGSEREVKADFDQRFLGHTDGEIIGEAALLEIKSVTAEKLSRIVLDNRALRAHFEQCQCYMKWGGECFCQSMRNICIATFLLASEPL